MKEQWNNAAMRFIQEQELSEYAKVNRKIVKARFSNLSGIKVLDLGCGYGYYTDYFNSIGADVIGVDCSEKMIEIACNKYPNCNFHVYDITKKLPFDNDSFDMIFCNQVLMDVNDVENVFSECNRILKSSGIFYYSIVHPAFYDGCWVIDESGYKHSKTISRYLKFYTLTNDFWGETTHFHRPLSFYLNIASKYNFVLKHTDEPVSYNGISKTKEIPLFFFAEYNKL